MLSREGCAASGRNRAIARGVTVAILSGGNVDVGLLGGLIARHETVATRRLHLFTRVSDRSAGSAGLLETIADTGASVREVVRVLNDVELNVTDERSRQTFPLRVRRDAK